MLYPVPEVPKIHVFKLGETFLYFVGAELNISALEVKYAENN